MLKLKLIECPLCFIQVYALNSSAQYPHIVEKTSCTLPKFRLTNPRSYWETSINMFEMTVVYESV